MPSHGSSLGRALLAVPDPPWSSLSRIHRLPNPAPASGWAASPAPPQPDQVHCHSSLVCVPNKSCNSLALSTGRSLPSLCLIDSQLKLNCNIPRRRVVWAPFFRLW